MLSYEKKAKEILKGSGIELNGNNPWDIKVLDNRAYERVFKYATLGFGEAYMDKWIEIEALDEFFYRIFTNKIEEKIKSPVMLLYKLKSMFSNDPYEVGRVHYDIGNDLYEKMLDKRMIYSCGYWKKCEDLPEAKNLDEAQEHKLEMICRKLKLKEGERVLDIGCGWGGLLKYMAEKYNIKGVGVSVSKKQIEYANANKGDLDLEFRLCDYRDVKEKFDKIVSVGMFEHVGYKHYNEFMKIANRCLKDDGLFLLHTIGSLESVKSCDPWINKYIFPNSMLPSLKQISEAAEGKFVIEDVHNFGYEYYPTLMSWYNNFVNAWDELKDKYDERFFRMWKFYLLSSAALFKARINQVWQIVLSKNGVKEGYVRFC